MRTQTVSADLWGAIAVENDNKGSLNRLSALLRQVMREELTNRQRDAFLLHVGQGLSQKEIARMWRVHPSVVCRHIQRAEDRIRRWTGKLADIADQ